MTLKTGVYSMVNVQCTFAQSSAPQLASLARGQTVTLRGTGDGEPLNVAIDNCSIVQ